LGIASAKGLGSAISEGFKNGLAKYAELAAAAAGEDLRLPNGCAHHSVRQHRLLCGGAFKGRPERAAHFVTVGGRARGDDAQFGALIGKFPAKNLRKVTETLLGLYEKAEIAGRGLRFFRRAHRKLND